MVETEEPEVTDVVFQEVRQAQVLMVVMGEMVLVVKTEPMPMIWRQPLNTLENQVKAWLFLKELLAKEARKVI